MIAIEARRKAGFRHPLSFLRTLFAFWLLLAPSPLSAQRGRGGPPRRLDNPETIRLASGARVEFKKFYSPALGREMGYSIFFPSAYLRQPERTFGVVYFLHGMFNDETSWCVDRYGQLPALLDRLISSGQVPPFVMVHPRGESGFYTDTWDGKERFEAYLYQDVLSQVESSYRVRKDRRGKALAGTSMGGYGALKLAFKHPGEFAAVAAGSPIILLGDNPLLDLTSSGSRFGQFFAQIFSHIYGRPFDRKHWRDNSLIDLAKGQPLEGLKIRILYGTGDRYNGLIPMEQGVRRLARILHKRGFEARLDVYENEGHGWKLIVDHLSPVVNFLTKSFH